MHLLEISIADHEHCASILEEHFITHFYHPRFTILQLFDQISKILSTKCPQQPWISIQHHRLCPLAMTSGRAIFRGSKSIVLNGKSEISKNAPLILIMILLTSLLHLIADSKTWYHRTTLYRVSRTSLTVTTFRICSSMDLPEQVRAKRKSCKIACKDTHFDLYNNLFHVTSTGKTSTIVSAAKRMYGGTKKYSSMTLELNASDARGIDVRSLALCVILFENIHFKLVQLTCLVCIFKTSSPGRSQ